MTENVGRNLSMKLLSNFQVKWLLISAGNGSGFGNFGPKFSLISRWRPPFPGNQVPEFALFSTPAKKYYYFYLTPVALFMESFSCYWLKKKHSLYTSPSIKPLVKCNASLHYIPGLIDLESQKLTAIVWTSLFLFRLRF